MAADLAAVSDRLDAHSATRQQATAALVALIVQLLRQFTAGRPGASGAAGWYSDAQVAVLAAQLAGTAEAVQRQVAASADTYLARVSSEVSGRSYGPAGQIDPTTLRIGTSHADAYARLARQYRWEVSQGTPPGEVLEHVVTRASVMAETDVALADRAQVERFTVVRRTDGYRRIVRPELSKSRTSCGLCIAASDRIYRRGDLAGIHGRCNCEWAPIINGQDPGRTLNRQDLDALYKRAGGTEAAKLKRVRYTEQEHAELGRVLAVEGQHFRGPEDLAA